MAETFELAPGLDLRAEAGTQVITIMGQRDSGKTHAGMKLAEGLHDVGVPLMILDPVGVWWSLTLGRDDGDLGLPIPVFGGERGHVDLTVELARPLASLLVQRRQSGIIDLSKFRGRQQQRFVEEFGDEVFVQARSDRYPRTLFVDEAQLFAPQVRRKDSLAGERIEDIVRVGRNFGIGTVLMTQRPQTLSKDVSSQSSLLLVGQMQGSHERKAFADWIGGDPSWVHELPSLRQGQMYLWSPAWLKIHKKLQILPKRTFDASRTPALGELALERARPTFDVDAIRAALQQYMKPPATESAPALKKRVAELEKQLQERPTRVVQRTVEVPTLPASARRQLAEAMDHIRAAQDAVAGALDGPKADHSPLVGLGAELADVVNLVHRFGSLSPSEVGVVLGHPADSAAFRRGLSQVFNSGQVAARGESIVLAPHSETRSLPDCALDPESIIGRWQEHLNRPQIAVLRHVVRSWPQRPSLAQTALATGYSQKTGSFKEAARILRKYGLLARTRNNALTPCRVLQRAS